MLLRKGNRGGVIHIDENEIQTRKDGQIKLSSQIRMATIGSHEGKHLLDDISGLGMDRAGSSRDRLLLGLTRERRAHISGLGTYSGLLKNFGNDMMSEGSLTGRDKEFGKEMRGIATAMANGQLNRHILQNYDVSGMDLKRIKMKNGRTKLIVEESDKYKYGYLAKEFGIPLKKMSHLFYAKDGKVMGFKGDLAPWMPGSQVIKDKNGKIISAYNQLGLTPDAGLKNDVGTAAVSIALGFVVQAAIPLGIAGGKIAITKAGTAAITGGAAAVKLGQTAGPKVKNAFQYIMQQSQRMYYYLRTGINDKAIYYSQKAHKWYGSGAGAKLSPKNIYESYTRLQKAIDVSAPLIEGLTPSPYSPQKYLWQNWLYGGALFRNTIFKILKGYEPRRQ